MLGNTHAVGDDGGPGFGVSHGDLGQGFARQAGLLFDILPAGGMQILGEGGESLGMLGNKPVVEHIALLLLQLQQRFGDPFQRRRVTAGPHLVVGRSDRRRAPGRHLHHVLRVGKTLQRPLTQRIENDNRHAAAGKLMQGAHHPWVVGARIMADGDHQLGLVKIVEGDGAFANPDRLRQAHAGGFVAHVGAVGEVVGAILAGVQLEQPRCLIGRPARGIELDLIRLQAAKDLADAGEGLLPRHRTQSIAGAVVD